MFTGIITATGQIQQAAPLGQGSAYGVLLSLQTPAGYLNDVALGDSIAPPTLITATPPLSLARHSCSFSLS